MISVPMYKAIQYNLCDEESRKIDLSISLLAIIPTTPYDSMITD